MTTSPPRRPIGTKPVVIRRSWRDRIGRRVDRGVSKAGGVGTARTASTARGGSTVAASPPAPPMPPMPPAPLKAAPSAAGPAKAGKPAKADKPAKVEKLARVATAGSATRAFAEVHPRILHRRAQVARGEHRRRSRVLWSVFAAVMLVAAAVGSLFSPVLDVDRVAVRLVGDTAGGTAAPPVGPLVEAAAAASKVNAGDPLVGVDAAAARRRVEELPWVAHAWVVTEWPDRVAVRVLPQRLVARVAEGGAEPASVGLVTGRVVPAAAVAPLGPTDQLRVLRVPAGRATDRDTARVLGVLHHLGPAAGAALGEATLGGDGTLTFTAGPGPFDGAAVDFGTLDLVPQKLQALEAALGGRIDASCVTHLDVSVPTRLTILRSANCPGPKG